MRKFARDGIASKRSISPTILGVFQETVAYKQAFLAYSPVVDSFFLAYTAIVDSFVIVSLFLEKHYILQHYR